MAPVWLEFSWIYCLRPEPGIAGRMHFISIFVTLWLWILLILLRGGLVGERFHRRWLWKDKTQNPKKPERGRGARRVVRGWVRARANSYEQRTNSVRTTREQRTRTRTNNARTAYEQRVRTRTNNARTTRELRAGDKLQYRYRHRHLRGGFAPWEWAVTGCTF